MMRRGLVAGLKGYERRVEQSMKDPGDAGYRPLHESAGISFVARSRKKLTGKSNWFRQNKKKIPEERRDEQETRPTALTIQEHRRGERKMKKELKKRERKEEQTDITTTSVMFVENTPHGELCGRLQRSADRMAGVSSRRVKMVEMGGTSLGQTFSNRNPWAGAGCDRQDRHTCNQGGEAEKKEDCFRRNILYESRCGRCEDRRADNGPDRKKRRRGEDMEEQNIYVGETSRSLYERTKEHIKDGEDKKEESHIAKHWEHHHQGEDMPEFRFRIVRTFRDSLSRQVAESIRIDLRGEGVLNSKTVYSRNHLPRVVIEKPAWEMEAEERWKRAAEAKEREEDRERQRAALGEGQAVRDEEMMTEEWRARHGTDRARDEQQDLRPSKRCKREMETTWGLGDEKDEQDKQSDWLMMK